MGKRWAGAGREGTGGLGRRRGSRPLEDIEGGRLEENKRSAQIILSGHFNSSHISVISPPFDLVNA